MDARREGWKPRRSPTGQIKVAYMGAFLLLFSLYGGPFTMWGPFRYFFFLLTGGPFLHVGGLFVFMQVYGGLFWACPTPTKISAASMGPDSTTLSLALLCGVWQFVISKSVQFLDCSSMTWETC